MNHSDAMDRGEVQKISIPLIVHHAHVPPDACIYVVSDVHGYLDVLQDALGLIQKDIGERGIAPGRPTYFLTLGDNIDKGSHSREVIERLFSFEKEMAARRHFKTLHMIGNHEKNFIDFLNGAAVTPGWVRMACRWLSQAGGWQTIQSYGILPEDNIKQEVSLASMEVLGGNVEDALERMRRDVLASPRFSSHIAHFSSLSTTAQWMHFVFCHARIYQNKTIESHSIGDVIRGRSLIKYQGAFKENKVVVYGHSSREEEEMPRLNENSIGIDPGVTRGRGPLVLALQGKGEARFLQRDRSTYCANYVRDEPYSRRKPIKSESTVSQPPFPSAILATKYKIA